MSIQNTKVLLVEERGEEYSNCNDYPFLSIQQTTEMKGFLHQSNKIENKSHLWLNCHQSKLLHGLECDKSGSIHPKESISNLDVNVGDQNIINQNYYKNNKPISKLNFCFGDSMVSLDINSKFRNTSSNKREVKSNSTIKTKDRINSKKRRRLKQNKTLKDSKKSKAITRQNKPDENENNKLKNNDYFINPNIYFAPKIMKATMHPRTITNFELEKIDRNSSVELF